MKNLLAAASLVLASSLPAQQVADTVFVPVVSPPAYSAGAGPRVIVDGGHHNFHTVDGRYAPFARLAARDGYRVSGTTVPLTDSVLAMTDILVIANALAARNDGGKWVLPTPSFVTDQEIAAVHRWVERGGSLLFIADHMPFAGAAEKLASTFGVTWVNGFANDSTGNSIIRYKRGAGLGDHAIIHGRNAAERIDSVTAFTGSAFFLREGGVPIFTLPQGTRVLMPATAWVFTDSTASVNGSGMLQLAALEIGKGRVVVAGEAGMLSAQRTGPTGAGTMGFNNPAAPQNGQFVLNILHWLSRKL